MRIFVTLCVSFLLGVGSVHAADEANGQKVFDKWCGICHGDDNAASGGGTAALKSIYKGALPAKLEDRTNLTPDFLEYMVRNGRASMPNFRFTEITKEELDDLIAYLTRNNP